MSVTETTSKAQPSHEAHRMIRLLHALMCAPLVWTLYEGTFDFLIGNRTIFVKRTLIYIYSNEVL